MGLLINVYRNGLGDCTNGGVSARYNTLTLVNAGGPFDPAPDQPAMVMERHAPGCLRLVPVELKKSGKWVMFGGNYAATSDSRFSELAHNLLGHTFYGAVAIHDRVE